MDNKERFSNRVDTYVKYRPSYPKEAIDYLYDAAGFRPDAVVADVGAGTGIFSRLLLERGSRLIAVEPNDNMREAAESAFGSDSRFRGVRGSAEATGLADESVDFIVCAQAFHWFDRSAAQTEFRRILKPGGKAALLWNTRLTHGSQFLEEYEALLHKFGTDYGQVNHQNISRETIRLFFQAGSFQEAHFPNRQIFDFNGLKGRLQSSSYSPPEGDPNFEPMMAELRSIFDRNEKKGRVFFDYVCDVYWGKV
ncbi:class I SAM-dependent methyltransferase [Cohnella pontilimi]|uniref:Class I SAM-dependent methyltransferase n=1 Tax=Cohnella pontilimi TaxID=2564100 RepID=A0A4U0FKC1_9BACL|nr:class I SAM-dependent methyltransferase [Cohnella pontilimi]TJY44002.1 class I SAM-dependent methyltransferase [Cohnella pontilimi]